MTSVFSKLILAVVVAAPGWMLFLGLKMLRSDEETTAALRMSVGRPRLEQKMAGKSLTRLQRLMMGWSFVLMALFMWCVMLRPFLRF